MKWECTVAELILTQSGEDGLVVAALLAVMVGNGIDKVNLPKDFNEEELASTKIIVEETPLGTTIEIVKD